MVAVDHDGRLWFRHPLLADVLYDAMPPDAVVRAHATFAEVLARAPQVAAADLAVHHERAGNNDEAFRWSLVAASSAAELHASPRRLSTWCAPAHCGRTSLRVGAAHLLSGWTCCIRASRASRLSSRYDDAKRLLETARNLLEEVKEPLVVSRLLSEWCEVTWEASGPTISRVRRDMTLFVDEDFPDSIERVSALTGLATAEAWDCDFVSARTHADQALAAARRNGSDLALAQALNTWGSWR